MKVILLYLTLMNGDVVIASNPLDNLSFEAIETCEKYKQIVNYENSERLKFQCKKVPSSFLEHPVRIIKKEVFK